MSRTCLLYGTRIASAYGVGCAALIGTAKGGYPDGAFGNGFPVEIYGSRDPKERFMELELLSPLRLMTVGSQWTSTVRWHIERMPSPELTNTKCADYTARVLAQCEVDP